MCGRGGKKSKYWMVEKREMLSGTIGRHRSRVHFSFRRQKLLRPLHFCGEKKSAWISGGQGHQSWSDMFLSTESVNESSGIPGAETGAEKNGLGNLGGKKPKQPDEKSQGNFYDIKINIKLFFLFNCFFIFLCRCGCQHHLIAQVHLLYKIPLAALYWVIFIRDYRVSFSF